MNGVWAPYAQSVELVCGGERAHLGGPDERGWWAAPAGFELAGRTYGFSVDGGPVRPDPRSPLQPEGVHGPSAPVDHSAFAWTDARWTAPPLAEAVIYELHVGTFSGPGTFTGVLDHLEHLCELGVTHVELMPVAQFPGRWGWGYDGVDLFAPHGGYGTPGELKALVDGCHARGLAVLADVVYNHLGPSGNYLGTFGPYFTDRYGTPWGQAVNLDGPDSDQVRAFFVDNARMWLDDYHFDGLRLDAVHAILDTSAVHLLEELAGSVPPHRVLIAESDLNDPRLVRPVEAGGYGLDAQWSDDLHHSLHALLTGERTGYYADFGSLADLAKALRQAFVYDGRYSRSRRRRHGRPPLGVPPSRFLGYAQTHDQVGNRAQGERLVHLAGEGGARVAAALVLCSPFVPMLFQGEEWGASTPFQYFTDHEDADLGRAVSEGRRREFAAFGWAPEEVPDPQDEATFERSRLRWDEVGGEPHAGLLDWHRRLVALRRDRGLHASGRAGPAEVTYDEQARWLVLDRQAVAVAVNFGTAEVRVPVRAGEVLMAWGDAGQATGALRLGPGAVAVTG